MAQWSMGSRFSYFLIDHSDHGLKLRSWLLNCVDHFFSGSVFFSTFYRWKISIFRCQKKNLLSLNGAAKRILQTSKKYQTNSIRRRFSIDLRIQSRFTFHFPFKSALHVLSLACRFFFWWPKFRAFLTRLSERIHFQLRYYVIHSATPTCFPMKPIDRA